MSTKESSTLDCTLCMGSHSSARCCQRVTDAVVFVFTEMGFFAINYLDDLGSAELEDDADKAFAQLQQLLLNFGLKGAFEKSCAPSTVMMFLGIEVKYCFTYNNYSQRKMGRHTESTKKWESKINASKKETQSLAGSLNFACKCVHSGRVYLSRILNFLRTLPDNGQKSYHTRGER